MSRDEKLVQKMLSGGRNIRFGELDGFLRRWGFEVRQPRSDGSHYVYKRGEGEQKIRLTIAKPHGGKKPVDPATVEEVVERPTLTEEEQEDDGGE